MNTQPISYSFRDTTIIYFSYYQNLQCFNQCVYIQTYFLRIYSWTHAFGYQLSIDLCISLDLVPPPWPGCPPALRSTLHMAARSRGLLVILLVPGCLSLWTPPYLGISHLDEWKWLLLTATVITGFPQAKKALCRHGHPRRHGGDHSPFFSPSWVPYWELGVHAGNTEKVWGPRRPGESYVWWMKGLSSLWP